MNWDAQLYDNNHEYVAEYGKGLLEFVPHKPNQAILDLGCGTGTLTAQLAKMGRCVIGVDSSQNMIDKAKEQFQEIDFMVCDALDLPFENEFDVIFSNAVFHWIDDHELLLNNIRKALKTGGVLICEFGAAGNIKTIDKAFSEQAMIYGHSCKSRFNFPATDTFSQLLKENHFDIESIYDFDRPTPLNDGEKGLENFIRQFYASELDSITNETQEKIIKGTEDRVKEKIWDGSKWVADYRRLRAIAHVQ